MVRMRRKPPKPWKGDGLVFVAGHPRSGTTFLGRLLGAHPQLGYWEEPEVAHFAAQLFHDLYRLNRRLAIDSNVDVRSLLERDNTIDFPLTEEEDVAAYRRAVRGTRKAVHQLLDEFRRRSGTPMVVDKTPGTVGLLDPVRDLMPEAKIVHIIRDPRDIATSVLRITERRGRPGFIPAEGDVVEAVAHHWVDMVTGGLASAEERGAAAIHTLRHEDLVVDPDGQFRPVLAFLGLAWVPEITAFLNEGNRQDRPRAQVREAGIDAARAGVWQDKLPPEDAELVVSIAGQLMTQLGYDIGGSVSSG